MGLFRRKETLNERLLREAGYEADGTVADADVALELTQFAPVSGEPGNPEAEVLTSYPLARYYSESAEEVTKGLPVMPGTDDLQAPDVVIRVEDPALTGELSVFVALMERNIVLKGNPGDASILGDALDEKLTVPYRAHGARQEGDAWTASAVEIDVIELDGVTGNDIEVADYRGERTITVDGAPGSGWIPELERADYAAHAQRLEGNLFAVKFDPL